MSETGGPLHTQQGLSPSTIPLSLTERAAVFQITEQWWSLWQRRRIEVAMHDAIERKRAPLEWDEQNMKLAARDNEAALNEALAAAQGEFKAIARDRTAKIRTKDGGSYSYSYADLASILAAVRPALAKHGLSITQLLGHNGGPGPTLRTELRHADGGAIVSELQLQGVDGGPQALGSLLTYMRRYAITAILGIATEDDDDGSQAQNGSGAADVRERAAAPEMITPARVRKIGELLEELEKQQPSNEGASWQELFCAEFGIRSRLDLTDKRAGAAIGWLKTQLVDATKAAA